METVRITIDGWELTVPIGRTVLEAALDNGISLVVEARSGVFEFLLINHPLDSMGALELERPVSGSAAGTGPVPSQRN